MPRDYYEVLGVPRSASAEEIRKAHRRLARKFHPDVNKEPDASRRFSEIQEAYDILGDEEKRKRYDRFGHAGVHGAGVGAGGEGSPFGSGSRGGFGGATGGWQEVDPQTFRSIFENFGDFFSTGSAAGARRAGRRSSFHGFDFGDVGGAEGLGGGSSFGGFADRTGADIHAETTVAFETAALGGTAPLSITRRDGRREHFDVKIPPGIADGAKLRLRGKGHPSPGAGPSGDLVVTVRVAPHPWFRREGLDILVDVPISIAEAALGGSVEVPLLRGSATLKIPPGASSGRKLRLKGKGITDASGRSGDFYAVLSIAAPENLSPEDREALERMRARLPDPRRGLWR